MDFHAFKDNTTRARKLRSSEILSNRSLHYAGHVIKELMEYSLDESEPCYIVSGSARNECFGDLVDYVSKFDANKNSIHLYLTDVKVQESVKSNAFVSAVVGSKYSKAYDWPKALMDNPPHFVVCNRRAYRLELDHKTARANFSFNNMETAATLDDLLAEARNMATPFEVAMAN